jgi:N-acetylneuraminate synthase/N,N'-diacetyllegionaminate synthase
VDGVVTIGGRPVGPGAPCFVVAEAGVNHNGDLELALRLVDAAAAARADAVKFQTFRAEAVAAPSAPKAGYQLESTGAGESQLEMLRGLELAPDAYAELKRRAEERGLVFLSSPFDHESVELLDELDVAAFKIASGEVTNTALLADVGRRGRPVILSSGTADVGEVEEAVATLRAAGARELVVLHCVSAYPAPAEGANLLAMATLAERLGLPVGFSDHTEGDEVALAAAALGACVLEKHFTLDRSLPGPDHHASLEPPELAELVRRVRRVEAAVGDGVKRPTELERANARVVRRSLAAARDLAAGTTLDEGMLEALRPGTGIAPSRLPDVVGRRLRRDLARGELLDPADLQ